MNPNAIVFFLICALGAPIFGGNWTVGLFVGLVMSFIAGFLNDVDWRWTYDVLDWSINSTHKVEGIDSIEKVLIRIDEDEPKNGKGLNYDGSEEIILTHDHENTAKYFKTIVDKLLEKDLKFKLP